MTEFNEARVLLSEFKGNSYLYGPGVLRQVGAVVAGVGTRAALVHSTFEGSEDFIQTIRNSLSGSGVNLVGQIKGPRPNCPRKDLFRIAEELKGIAPDVLVSFGGGSTIDAAKAAEVVATLGGEIDSYFGVGFVGKALQERGGALRGHVAIQAAASSAAHLTKYSNITDLSTGQKKLIVDEAIVPAWPVFDYEATYGEPGQLTVDGALDGIAHCLEVLYGAVGKPYYDRVKDAARICITLVVEYLPRAIMDPRDKMAREALCLATDLGGYSIMTGGTNGGHLTSFSLVDILTHGRACAVMNPYYTVFFAPAIEDALRLVGGVYRRAGLTVADVDKLSGRELGIAVAEAMFEFARRIGFPIRLGEVEGFSSEHIERALTAATNPQLEMKLQNMPVPLTAAMVDEYMRPILEAARDGDLATIRNV